MLRRSANSGRAPAFPGPGHLSRRGGTSAFAPKLAVASVAVAG